MIFLRRSRLWRTIHRRRGRSVSPVFANGGGVSNAAAVAIPELACAVPFYGRQPPLKEVDKIKAPLLLHYAGLDSGINEGWPAYEQAFEGTP
ncbi:putative enzyme [Klebsiella pneumoniae subsp. ozaenae]|uniref:Putative enzyme n=1 Tax=Klebsiella pneumoniae subsp. ozaenae TaxID=574 RepID=A0A377Z2P5_KLEPO|nr:putative enzyme [Klebsiella pneumoniae subsp. ozaenae]